MLNSSSTAWGLRAGNISRAAPSLQSMRHGACSWPIQRAQLSRRRENGIARALPPPAHGMDWDVTQPALELIMRTAGNAAGAIDTQFVADMMQPLYSAFCSPADGTAAADTMSTAASMNMGFESIGTAVIQAAPQAVEAAAAAHVVGSAAAQAAQLEGLAAWASSKLATVATLDPAAYASMQHSLSSLIAGLHEAFPAIAAREAPHAVASAASVPWTNAVVVGVQQLVTALRHPAAGGASVEAMVAAQEAMNVALAGAASEVVGLSRAASTLAGGIAAGEMPAGLSGLLQLMLGLIAMVVASVPRSDWKQDSAAGALEIPNRYDVNALSDYFARKPMMVLQRNSDVVSKLTTFCLALLADWRMGRWEANMPQRAVWARKVCEELGPAYIKIAQAISTRADVMPKVYVDELTRLHDNVKTFSTVEARRVLEEGLGTSVDQVFEWLSEEPIAAASLGQVYRGKLRQEYGGGEVAVKVQRPGSLESVALDIFIMRRSAVLFSQLPGMSDKWASALDDWAERFFQEMDYQLEAHNTMTFKKHMASLEGVCVATVYPQLTSRQVIVTEWIEGERLNDAKPEEIKALCSTLLNCYLIQLLETGLLHADPHPGNLMRTHDGRIVVLDFGLMTEVTEDQRIALVEYIAHLTLEDWEGVANDLVKLGFMPEGLPPEVAPLIAPVMEKVMGQLVKGGGLGSFNIAGVASELSGVAMNYQLAIPPYFALVIRAFSVIEGIALQVDPKYAIVQECMPYMSRRLLSDNNPRMRAALKQLLYGDGTRLDVERLQKMFSSFTEFTTSAAPNTRLATGPTFSSAYTSSATVRSLSADQGLLGALLSAGDEGPIMSEPMKDMLKVVFSKEGTYAQEILVDEAVAAIDAMSREAVSEALKLVSSSAATVTALRSMEALGPLRAMLLPLPLPTDMLRGMQPMVTLTHEDKQALSTVRSLMHMVSPSAQGPGQGMASMGVKAARVAGEVVPMLPELLPGMQATGELFLRQLVRRMALRLAEDLNTDGSKAIDAQPTTYTSLPPPQPPAAGPRRYN